MSTSATRNRNKKKKFVRTNVSRQERLSSAALLVLLAGIGAAILVKGQHYDPSRYAPEESALAATAAAVDLPGAAIESSGGSGLVAAPANSSLDASSPADAGPALELPGVQVTPLGPTEHYVPDTLYEKINGRAEGYHEYGFAALAVRTFGLPDGQAYVDIYDFDMGNAQNAFGMYALERDPDGSPLTFTNEGYRSGMGLFFQKGRHYVQVLASDPGAATMVTAEAAARTYYLQLPEEQAAATGEDLLPVAGRREGSLEFTRQDAFGIAGFDNVYKATYRFQDHDLTFFAAQSADDAAAADMFSKYRDTIAQFGTIAAEPPLENGSMFVAENFGQTTIVAQRGPQLFGVVDAPDRAAAESMLQQYLDGALAEGEPAPPASNEAPADGESYDGYAGY